MLSCLRRVILFAAAMPALLLSQDRGEPVPAPPNTSLVVAQKLIDEGRFSDAEASVRAFLKEHRESADAHYLLAYVLFREGSAKASLAEFDEGMRYRPPTAADLQVVGCDYFLLEDYASAEQWLRKAVDKNPADAQALYFLGRAKYNETHFDDAVAVLAKALKLDPKNGRAEEYLGLSYERLGRTADAVRAYRAAVAAAESATTPWEGPFLELGSLLAEDNHAIDALPYLGRAVKIAPGDSAAHRQLGKAYLQLGRYNEALAALDQANRLAPNDPTIHLLLAEAYRGLNLADKARAELQHHEELTGSHSTPETPLAEARSLLDSGKVTDAERVTRLYLHDHPRSAEAHFLLGYILFREQDARASLAEYTEGAKYRTPTANDLVVVGSDYVLLGDYADADKWFKKSVEWNPNNVLAVYYLGRAKYNENRFEEAVHVFLDCLKLDPRNVKAEDNLGLSYEGLGKTEEAMAAYRQAIAWQADLPVRDPGPYVNLGSILVDNDKPEEGVKYLTEAVALAPRDPKAHRQLGKAFLHMNQLAEARRELETAVELSPDSAPLHFMLGQAYRRQGLAEKAKAEFNRYAALNGTRSTPAQ